MKEVNSKIRTKCSNPVYMGKYGDRRIQVTEFDVVSWKGFRFWKFWIGFIKLGEKRVKGIAEHDF